MTDSLRFSRVLASVLLLAAASGCGSVPIPEQHFYRLELPEVRPSSREPADQLTSAVASDRGGIIRVADLQLAAELEGDRLLVAVSPVRVQAYEFHRWSGALERLVGDSIVVGLTRSGAFAQVKSDGERGREDWILSGRVLSFHQVASAVSGWTARVGLHLKLSDSRGQLIWQSELLEAEPLANGDSPEHLAAALSAALNRAVDAFVTASEGSRSRAGKAFSAPGPR